MRLHPIKSLDPVDVKQARIGPNGGLEGDRTWALYSVDGRWVNAKRTAAMHLLRAAYAPDLSSVTLSVPADRRNISAGTFAFPQDTERAAQWFSAYFEQQVIVRYALEGLPDDALASGPTIISSATLEAVCGWFPGLTIDEARLRFRTTLEIDGVPGFWEDQLFGQQARSVVRFRIGEVAFEGSNPCARCPVPSRDPYTGRDISGFQKRFSELRRTELPRWSPAGRFDHFYRLATNTRVASTESGKLLRVGDPLNLV
ncbi:MAG TPA: MOSC N-terminal beta barrel domain-containing protein [Candidatus Dormibacteraeota bacterium]|nr:MOSC N-terminal beta barrel domain-containing protein [Candidatus Dormibacteraeota bacterium]